MERFEIVATTQMGLEGVLMEEIEKLGGENIELLKRAVRFSGSEYLLYKTNLCSRVALRVLVPILRFYAYQEEELYESIKRFEWETLLDSEKTFAIDATTSGIFFKHSKYAALKVKDAIVDRFRQKTGKRPSVDTENPDLRINIHIAGEEVNVSLDSSGNSLDRRGYRIEANEAPINEGLAAGIILLSGWDASKPFYDPMSGSGTFGIEAAFIGTNTPPGIFRSFGFEKWRDFNAPMFDQVLTDAKKAIKEVPLEIYCSDLLTSNTEIIAENAKRAEVEKYIKIKREDFFLTELIEKPGTVVINPPYGERIKVEDLEIFYSRIGDTLKQKYIGCEAWIISSNMSALKRVGLKANKKIDLKNGGLDARLNSYNLFSGKLEENKKD